jgi:hypothetical protein
MDNSENQDFSWDINTIIDFIKNNYIQILMFLSVFVIIYVVDYISNINAVLFGIPSAVPGQNTTNQPKKAKLRLTGSGSELHRY